MPAGPAKSQQKWQGKITQLEKTISTFFFCNIKEQNPKQQQQKTLKWEMTASVDDQWVEVMGIWALNPDKEDSPAARVVQQ